MRLEQQFAGGAWTIGKPIERRPDGRFTVTVTPRPTTSYRLATPVAAGVAGTVKTP